MPRIRVQIRAVIIAIAAMAVIMGLLKNLPHWIDRSDSAPRSSFSSS